MKKFVAAAVACLALAAPGAALANHVTDVDGPAVSSINGICHGKPGHDWYLSQKAAAQVYYDAFLSTGYQPYIQYAVEHLTYAAWYEGVCK